MSSTLNEDQIRALAKRLDRAAFNADPIEQLSASVNYSLDDAYAIQKVLIGRRQSRGEHLTGIKLGFTSKAKMEQMGVHDLIWGWLTDHMAVVTGKAVTQDKLIHPRAEPELVFRLSRPVEQAIAPANAKDYIDAVAAGIEIIDSRYRNFKFSLEDVVADNCSAALYVVGEWHDPDISLSELDIHLQFDGTVVQKGYSAAILGDPLLAISEVARLVSAKGLSLPAGTLVFAGAATPADYFHSGQTVSATVEKLGSVSFTAI